MIWNKRDKKGEKVLYGQTLQKYPNPAVTKHVIKRFRCISCKFQVAAKAESEDNELEQKRQQGKKVLYGQIIQVCINDYIANERVLGSLLYMLWKQLTQGVHSQGKSQGKIKIFKVRELSGNFDISQGIFHFQPEVREKSELS